MEAPKHFLGKFITGKALPAELAAAAQTAKLDIEDLEDRLAPHVYGLILEMYGPERREEVEEALEKAKEGKLGDIAGKLQAWLDQTKAPTGARRKTRRRKTARRKTRMAKKSRRTYK